MRLVGWIFAALAGFIAVLGAVYWLVSGYEPAGSVMLLGTALLLALTAAYLVVRTRGLPPPPEDRTDAEVREGAGEVGYFSGGSIWPFGVGLAAMVAGAGMAVSTAAFAYGVLFVVLATIALVIEGWRG